MDSTCSNLKETFLNEEDLLKEVENKLEMFFESKKIIAMIDYKIDKLTKKIEILKVDIKNLNIEIQPESKSQNFNEKVQTSSDGLSYAEKEMLRMLEKMEDLQVKYTFELFNLKEERFQIEIETDALKEKLESMEEDKLIILNYLYSERKNESDIAKKLNIDRSCVSRKKTTILREIENYLYLSKELMHKKRTYYAQNLH